MSGDKLYDGTVGRPFKVVLSPEAEAALVDDEGWAEAGRRMAAIEKAALAAADDEVES